MEEYVKTDTRLSQCKLFTHIFSIHTQKSVLDSCPRHCRCLPGATLTFGMRIEVKAPKEIKANNPNCTTIVGGGNVLTMIKKQNNF